MIMVWTGCVLWPYVYKLCHFGLWSVELENVICASKDVFWTERLHLNLPPFFIPTVTGLQLLSFLDRTEGKFKLVHF